MPVALAVFPAVGFAAVVTLAAPAVVFGAAVVDDGLFLPLLHAAATSASTATVAATPRPRLRDNVLTDMSEIPLSDHAIRRNRYLTPRPDVLLEGVLLGAGGIAGPRHMTLADDDFRVSELRRRWTNCSLSDGGDALPLPTDDRCH